MNKKIVAVSSVLVLILVSMVCVVVYVRSNEQISIDPAVYYPITYVVDGDTFKVSIRGTVITVRVLGINTPETVDPRKPVQCFGPEASARGKQLLTGKKVELHFNPNRELEDKYGRYLAYVYLEDGTFYNEVMLKDGFAREYTVGNPYSLQKEFRSVETVAKGERKGLWGVCN